MASEDEKQSRQPSGGQSCYVPARYVFAGIATLGIFVSVVLRASLPVAITAMVKRNSSVTTSINNTDTCPSGAVEHESSSGLTTGDFAWDEVTQSWVLTAGSYGMLLTNMVGSRVSELWSPKYMFAVSTGLSAALYLLLPVTAQWSVVVLIISQFLSGMLLGPTQPTHMALCASWFPPDERQQLGGITLSAINLGFVVSNAVTGNLVDSAGWQFVFYLFASIAIAWTALWMYFGFDSPNTHPRISEEERIYINERTKKDEHETVARLPWKEILLSTPLWAHIAMGMPGTWLSLSLSNALPTYMKNILHYSTTKAGYFSAVPPVASWLSVASFGFIAQWVRRKQFFSHIMTYHIFNGIATLGTAAALVCITLVGCNAGAIISLMCVALACSGAYIGGSQLNHMDLAVNYSGTLYGLASTVFSAVGALAPTITGVLTNNQQTLAAYNRVFYVAAGVSVVPFFIYLIFGSVDEQPWNRVQQKETDIVSTSNASTVDIEVQSQKNVNKLSLRIPK